MKLITIGHWNSIVLKIRFFGIVEIGPLCVQWLTIGIAIRAEGMVELRHFFGVLTGMFYSLWGRGEWWWNKLRFDTYSIVVLQRRWYCAPCYGQKVLRHLNGLCSCLSNLSHKINIKVLILLFHRFCNVHFSHLRLLKTCSPQEYTVTEDVVHLAIRYK